MIGSIEFLGDAALLLRIGDRIDAAVNRRVHGLAVALRAQAPDWLTDITPAFACLALHVDVARMGHPRRPDRDPLDEARDWLLDWLAKSPLDAIAVDTRSVEIPVVYGGGEGPDLAAVATQAGLSVDEVVSRHVSATYTVAMLGFSPGFPYLLGLDASLAMPRLASPRTHVQAGSVGIGGAQTGIYPNAGPGGWRLIGRTPLKLFDALRDPPCLLRAGDHVRFVATEPGDNDFDATRTQPR